jgi:hypothetical protein
MYLATGNAGREDPYRRFLLEQNNSRQKVADSHAPHVVPIAIPKSVPSIEKSGHIR